jgi:DNA-binding CsgD family transcriptional regulator
LALLRAWQFAHDLGQSAWEFAVEIRSLRDSSMTDSDLRWLVKIGFAEHAIELVGRTSKRRQFSKHGRFPFVERTCFVLTAEGVDYVRTNVIGHQSLSFPNGAPLIGANGNGLSPIGASPFDAALSTAQREVLALLAKGLTEEEIARDTGRSYHTVHNHVRAIYRAFGVRSRGACLAKAVDLGQPPDLIWSLIWSLERRQSGHRMDMGSDVDHR